MATTDNTADSGDSVIRAINAMWNARPGLFAPQAEWAAWFDRKANVFDLLASTTPDIAAGSIESAADARAMAARLRGGGDR